MYVSERMTESGVGLTAKQAEVVGLVARGQTNKEIAARLRVSQRAVSAQLSRLMRKFDVPNRAGLIAAVMSAAGVGLPTGMAVPARTLGAQLQLVPADLAAVYENAPFMGDSDAVLAELAHFVSASQAEEAEFDRVLATVLFTDVVGSTQRAETLGDRAWRELVERHHATVRALLGRYRGTEVKTAGDGFFATFDGPARAVRCAQAIVKAVRSLGIEIRAGVHTGEVETIDGEIGGLAVHIGARVGTLAGASEVLASSTVKDLTAGSGLLFEDAGEHELKGVSESWHLYRVTSPIA